MSSKTTVNGLLVVFIEKLALSHKTVVRVYYILKRIIQLLFRSNDHKAKVFRRVRGIEDEFASIRLIRETKFGGDPIAKLTAKFLAKLLIANLQKVISYILLLCLFLGAVYRKV